MGRWGVAIGPVVIHQIHDRIVQIARANDVVQGRRMRIDTTVVESNIHYPTDSSLLGDGVRVLTRTMRKITQLTGQVGARLRDRSRGVGLRLLEIARAARGKAPPSQARMKLAYGRLLNATGRVVGQAKRFSKEITTGVTHSMVPARQVVLEGPASCLTRCSRGSSRSSVRPRHASSTVTAAARARLSACSLVSYWNEKAKLGLVATGRWPAPAPPHPRELWEW
jgi:hypothetical protein